MPNIQKRKQATAHCCTILSSRLLKATSKLELKTSEMHHPAASIIGSCSVIHDVADIPQPIRIPFSCNGGEHSWNYRVGCFTRRTDCTLVKPCFKTIKGFFFPFKLEIWKHRTSFKYLSGLNFICRHNSNSNI